MFLPALLAVCVLSSRQPCGARAAGEQQAERQVPVIWKRLEHGDQVAMLGEDSLRYKGQELSLRCPFERRAYRGEIPASSGHRPELGGRGEEKRRGFEVRVCFQMCTISEE